MTKIYLRLDEEMSERFSWIKEYLGLENDTEVLRFLINQFWRKRQRESVLERVLKELEKRR